MSAALRMAETLSAHALAVFDLFGADPALDGARVILRWIEREGKSDFTFRDCHYAPQDAVQATRLSLSLSSKFYASDILFGDGWKRWRIAQVGYLK